MDFSAKISNVIKICESDQNVEFRPNMRKMIQIWKFDRSMEFCSNFQCSFNRDHAIEREFDHGGGLHALLRGTIISPITARVRLIGRKRRRGRRPQAAAWMCQPFNLNSPITHPEQNEAALAGLVLPDMPAFDDIMNE